MAKGKATQINSQPENSQDMNTKNVVIGVLAVATAYLWWQNNKMKTAYNKLDAASKTAFDNALKG